VGLTSALKGKADTLPLSRFWLGPTSRPDYCRDDARNTPKIRRLFCPTSQARLAKIYLFPKWRNFDLTKPSRPHEGRFAIVTIRGAGCDGRGWRADDARRKRTVKPCGPGIPTLVLSLRSQVDRRQRLTSPVLWGERGAAVKPLRRECRAISACLTYLWAFSFSAHEDCGCG
jgi:hypothetical protein